MPTKITPFKFPPAVLSDIDQLKDHLALPSRSAVVSLAIRRLARAEIPNYRDASTAEKTRKKSSKKSG